MGSPSSPDFVATSGVGVPLAERRLTEALTTAARSLIDVGRGYTLYVLDEVPLGVGRPDLLLIVASPHAVAARESTPLRLRNLTEAEVLARTIQRRATRHTDGHTRQVQRRLKARGWCLSEDSTPPKAMGVRSLLVEAKVSDWKRGLTQLSRERWGAHRAALAVPATVQQLVEPTSVSKLGLGLLTVKDGVVSTTRRGRHRRLSLTAQLWLDELLLRHVESR